MRTVGRIVGPAAEPKKQQDKEQEMNGLQGVAQNEQDKEQEPAKKDSPRKEKQGKKAQLWDEDAEDEEE